MTTATTTISPANAPRKVVVARCKWCTQRIAPKKAGTPGREKTDFCGDVCKREARNAELKQGALVLRLAKRWRKTRGSIKGSFNDFTRALDEVCKEDAERRQILSTARKAAEAKGERLPEETLRYKPKYSAAEFIDQIR